MFAAAVGQVVAKCPLLRSEVLSLATENALVGPILELYDNILAADFNKHKVGTFFKQLDIK